MENAVDALKIAFAIFVFLLGLTMLFMLTSQATETARILIAEADKTTYYQYYESDGRSVDDNGNRIVTFKDIIPALYRYSEENYAVTIVNRDGDIVARFDLDTEANCNSWDDNRVEPYTKYKFITELNNVFTKVNTLANKIHGNRIRLLTVVPTGTIQRDDNGIITYCQGITKETEEGMKELFRKLYGQIGTSQSGTIRRDYYCYWLAQMGCASQRIDSDISRNRCIF